MPGTRTAPAVGTISYKQVTVYLIDFTGDSYPVTFRLDPAASDVDIETFVVALQAMTNASVHRVDVTSVHRGLSDPSNAANAPRTSVYQGINLLFRDAAFNAQSLRVPAPLDSLMLPNTDLINGSSALYAPLVTAYQTIVSGSPDWESASYSERKETNTRSKI